ncbi:MAG: transketolase [Bacteriovorax sp.]|nr:transketolase [Bacteriovorax sp.]
MKNGDQSELDLLCINALRFLAVDAVEKAKSGHPGLPLGASPMAYTLWDRFLKYNPLDPEWTDRDRFVLSAGHGSALLYSLLYLTGFNLSLDELKKFRQWNSLTPGHPEYRKTPGVEATTGPLGQGFSNAVGMAMAEQALGARFNRPGHEIINHYTYVIASDGDMMEGVTSEAASFAGHQRLGKLIVLYDQNRITIEGSTTLAFTEDVGKRFSAYEWHTQHIEDGNKISSIIKALEAAKEIKDRPSLIVVSTHIGFGSPHKQDSEKAHGEPLGSDEVILTKQNLGWPIGPSFFVPDEALKHFRMALSRGKKDQSDWNERFNSYSLDFPALALELERVQKSQLPLGWSAGEIKINEEEMSSRSASEFALNNLAVHIPELIGGAADLAPSTKTYIQDGGDFSAATRTGLNIHFGIREHAMGGILNGITLHKGFIVYGATFLIFSDYMRPPIRLAAMNELPVIYIFTHDSIALGEDGPTHQPVEQLLGLRSIPGLTVLRPADANETLACWEFIIANRSAPIALILTRQKLPILHSDKFPQLKNGVSRGGYILSDTTLNSKLNLILLATGSEVHLALEVQRRLENISIAVRVVSIPSVNIFADNPDEYQEEVLPHKVPKLVIEAGRSLGWNSYLSKKSKKSNKLIEVVGVDRYGASAPGEVVMKEYGFNVENIFKLAQSFILTANER